MTRRRGQDDLTRRRRLNDGLCPTHGVALTQTGVHHDPDGTPAAPIVGCPRGDCDFVYIAKVGTKVFKVVTGG